MGYNIKHRRVKQMKNEELILQMLGELKAGQEKLETEVRRTRMLVEQQDHKISLIAEQYTDIAEKLDKANDCALPGFVDSKNEEKTERNAGYLVVSHSGGGMLRQGTRKGIRRTPANRGMRAHWVVKGLDISEDVCHGMCP